MHTESKTVSSRRAGTKPRSNAELLPCPFCGSPGILIQTTTGQSAVRCMNDICPISNVTVWTTFANAIGQWNTRAKTSAEQALNAISQRICGSDLSPEDTVALVNEHCDEYIRIESLHPRESASSAVKTPERSEVPITSGFTTFQNGQRCQILMPGIFQWRLASFIAYSMVNCERRAIVITSRQYGRAGMLHHVDPRDVFPVEFDANGRPLLRVFAPSRESLSSPEANL